MIEKITYKEALEKIADLEDKMVCIYFVNSTCGACKHVLDNIIEPLSEEKFSDTIAFYKIVSDDENDNPFPPLRVPLGYFYMKEGEMTIREGAAPKEVIEAELKKMLNVRHSDQTYDEVFQIPDPEQELKDG